jgi:hypothetical protein
MEKSIEKPVLDEFLHPKIIVFFVHLFVVVEDVKKRNICKCDKQIFHSRLLLFIFKVTPLLLLKVEEKVSSLHN